MKENLTDASSRRRSIGLIVASALVPLLLFATFQIGFAAREQRRTIEAHALAQTQQLIVAADGEVARIGALLDALATSTFTKGGNWPGLTGRFRELAALNGDLRGFEVVDRRSGTRLMAVGAPIASPILIADGRSAARPLFIGYARSAGCRCLMFQRAATSAGGKRVTLTLLTDADIFLALLPPRGKRFEVSAYNDPHARFIARTIDSDSRFGTLASRYLQAAVASSKASGIYRGLTLEGFENYTAFARSQKTGWTAHVALSSSYIDAPAWRFLASLVMAALLSLLLAGLLIAFALRQVNQARRLSERLQQGQKMEALGQLTGGIAHDFNNLLTPIVGVLDQLRQRDGLDERGRKLAALALASAQRAAKLTSQLLTFSRRQGLQIAPVDVPKLASDVTGMVERAFGGDHRFEIAVADGVGFVASDANQLELALLNLALNARDASPAGTTIELTIAPVPGSAGSAGPDIGFTMRDEGAGMDAETQRRAIEPFFTTKPVGRGTGLGLAQVLGLAEQSGGSLTIASAVGAGTTIALRLPSCAPPADRADPRVTQAPVLSRPLRLLVVDDDPTSRATIARTLEAEGHWVDSVAAGETALAALRVEPFDLLIVDFQMPTMNGAELLSHARAIREDVVALVVTGYADTSALAASGAAAQILAKPFTARQLIDAVQGCVRAQPALTPVG